MKHHLLNANTNLNIELKIFTSSICICITSFIEKKAKYNFGLLLLPPVTTFI